MKKSSVLELLHPDGIAHKTLILGNNCPQVLRSESAQRHDGTQDLLIVAPSDYEINSQGWLESAVDTMSRSLSADGIGYVLVSPRQRGRVMRLLRESGLLVDSAFWHFPNVLSSPYLVPLERSPGQFFVDTIFPAPSWKRTIGMQMFRSDNIRQLFMHYWEPIGISVRRRGARPLFQWLFASTQPAARTAILRRSWRVGDSGTIMYGFSGQDVIPSITAKTLPADAATKPNQEAHVLNELGSVARETGVSVPEMIGTRQNEQTSTLILSFIPGRAVSDLLKSNSGLYSEVLTKIVDWLERWHRATRIVGALRQEEFEKFLLAPLDRLTSSLQNTQHYRERLVACATSLVGDAVPWVATHNDLTMANILLDERDQLGILDWETGCPKGLPWVDFYYALTDATRIAAQCSDWLEAFKACYLPGGSYFTQTLGWRKQLQSALGSPAEFAEYCFHACWLHHASNEQLATQPGEPRPFLEIVQWLATHEFKFDEITQ